MTKPRSRDISGSMFGLSMGHLIILLLVVLLLGAKRLPELGSALGRGMREFKKGLEGKDEDRDRQTAQKIEDRKKTDT